MVESILPLNNINHQFGKADAVLSHVGIHSHWLHHIVHQEQALCVLQDPLCQVLVRAVIIQCPTLKYKKTEFQKVHLLPSPAWKSCPLDFLGRLVWVRVTGLNT